MSPVVFAFVLVLVRLAPGLGGELTDLTSEK